MKPIKIPRRIDEPPHLLLWSIDELAPMLIGLTFGIILGKALILFIIGLLITNLYKRFRDAHPDGYLFHMIYWWGFMYSKASCFKNPYIKRFYP